MSLRVAAYCRVSTDREDQANSLQSQRSYFRDYIQRQEGWTLAEVYADEGTSGTSTRRREAFNRMIRAAEAGEIDLILTKEVSRFARNTVDALEYTRRLKQNGIGVVFISDNIDTRDNDGELRLTIMASMAQEESRKTSERVKWGQRRRMEAGVVFGNNSTYGFDTKNGALRIREDEAAVVRHIFQKFLHEGKGTHVIARELYEEGIAPPKTASGKWSSVMVRRILRNEKYVGDLLQKKYVTVDFLTHRKVENRGQEEQIYLRDHHQAVVDRPTWDAAQRELARRSAEQGDKSRYSSRYWCSGKIRCGICGSRFVPRTTRRSGGTVYKTWGCGRRVRCGSWQRDGAEAPAGCAMRMVNDKTLTECARYVLGQLGLDWDALAAEVAEDVRRVCAGPGAEGGRAALERRCAELRRKKERAMDACFSGVISEEELIRMKETYDGELDRLERRLRRQERAERIRAGQERTEALEAAVRERIAGSEEVLAQAVEQITVYQTYIEFQIRCLPARYRLWYTTAGAGERYTTTIERCEICEE